MPFIFPVGRLDKETTGALLFTNDSQLAERLANPESKFPKKYHVVAEGIVDEASLRLIREGINVEGKYITLPASVANVVRSKFSTECDITIVEGKNRQIRKMFEAIGHPVVGLSRISIGPLALGSLPSGAARRLTQEEVGLLHRKVL